MGVDIRCGRRMGVDIAFEGLAEDYDAVFMAIGAQSSQSMRVEGEGAALPGIDFLERVAHGESVDTGDRVVVVGGGNTAVDAARTAVRLGAKEVAILYRRTREEMPADELEVEAAIAEGVEIRLLAAPISMEKAAGGVKLTCIEMELGEPDASGRRRPKPIDGSEFTIEATSVVAAIGQGVDADCIDESSEIKLTKWNTLDVNPETFETSRPGVFAGGDCATGADIAVRAIAAGRRAAASIGQFLRGEPVVGDSMGYLHRIAKGPDELPDAIRRKVLDNPGDRVPMPELAPKERVRGFDEVEMGLGREQALEEAARCVACGCRTFASCKLRKYAVDFGAEPERFAGSGREIFVDDSHPTIRYEAHKCIMCGSCVRVCSEVKGLDALGFVRRGFSATMKPAMEKPWNRSSCDSCMKCVPMCPTGAISIRVTPAGEAKGSFAGVDASKDVEEER
jgi:formate dehydrogenase major subunit